MPDLGGCGRSAVDARDGDVMDLRCADGTHAGLERVLRVLRVLCCAGQRREREG